MRVLVIHPFQIRRSLKLTWNATAPLPPSLYDDDRLLFGFDQGLVSITLVMPQFLKTFPEIDKEVMGAGVAEFNKGYAQSCFPSLQPWLMCS